MAFASPRAAAPVSPKGHDRPLYALALRLIAMLAISFMFAGVKWLSEHGVHIIETLFFRQLLALPVVLVGVLMGPGLASIRTSQMGLHVSRTLMGMIGMVFNFGSYILLPLAEATTIGFSMPLFATILAALFLREPTGIHRWSAVLIGFVGVIVIAQPGMHFDISPLGFGVAVSAAIATAVISMLLRRMSQTEIPTTIVFWFSTLSVPVLGAMMPFFAQAHDPVVWAILIGTGMVGGLAQIFLTSALRWGPVAVVLPMDYSALLWSTLMGWFLWDKLPAPTTWIGAALIIASGLYIVWREQARKRVITDIIVPRE